MAGPITVELPNGARLELEGDLTPDQVQAKAADAWARIQAGEVSDGPSVGEQVAHGAGLFGTGANRGIAGVVGLPVDIANNAMGAIEKGWRRALNDAGIGVAPPAESALPVQNPVGGSESILSGFRTAGIPETEATTPGGRILQRVGEEVGAAAVPVGATLNAARKGAQAAPALMRPFVETAQRAPAKMAAGETALAVGGGAGAGVAGEIFPENIWGELGGQIAGSFTLSGAADLARFGARKVSQAAEPFTQAGIRRRVGRDLVESAADPDSAFDSLDGDADYSIPGFRPTTAQASNDPGLAVLQEGAARANPQSGGRFEQRRTEQNQALRGELDAIAPPADVGFENVQGALRTRLDALSEAIDRRIANAQQSADQALEGVAPGGHSGADASVAAQGELRAAERDFRTTARTLFDAVDPDGSTQINTGKIKAAASEIVSGRRKAESPGDTPEVVTDAVPLLDDAESFAELRSLRSRILGDVRAEESLPAPNRNKVRKLNQLLDAVDSTLDDLATSPDAAVAERYRAARSFFAENAPKFRSGPVRDVLRPNFAPSATLGRLFRGGPGSREAAQQLISAVGDRPQAIEAVRAFALDQIRNLATDGTGAIKPARMRAWMNKHRDALSAFPELRRDLMNAADTQARLDEVTTGMAPRVLADVERDAARLYLDRDPEQAIATALRHKNPAGELLRLRRSVRMDPDAEAGLRRAFWDNMLGRIESRAIDGAGDPFLDPAKMRSFVRANERSMRALFSPNHVARIKQISEAAAMAATATPAARLSGGGAATLSLNQVLSRAYNVQRGVVSGRFVIGEVGSRILNRVIGELTAQQSRALLEEALLDPAVAKTLMTKVMGEKQAREVANKLRGHLLNMGVVTTGALREDEAEGQPPLPTLPVSSAPRPATPIEVPPGPGRLSRTLAAHAPGVGPLQIPDIPAGRLSRALVQ